MKLLINKMTLNDLEKISDTLSTDFDDFWSSQTLKSELENEKSYYLVGKIDNEIVGFRWYASSFR